MMAKAHALALLLVLVGSPHAWAEEPAAGSSDPVPDELEPSETGKGGGEEAAPSLPAWRWLERFYAAKSEGNISAAREALRAASEAGGEPQLLEMELGYLELAEGNRDAARAAFERAGEGPDEERSALARAEVVALSEEELRAEPAGPSEESMGPQYAALKAGYAAKEAEDFRAARGYFKEARAGENAELSAQARSELRYLPKLAWGDAYLEGYGWHRFAGASTSDFVPTLRVRGFLHPIPKVDLDPYVFVQVSRDVASRAEGPEGYPLIYADNHLMLGGGLQFRFWKKRVGLFAQVGPAFNLVRGPDDPLVELDVRAGIFFVLQVPNCSPAPEKRGARKELAFCADIYSEAVYVSRFDHNLLATARARVGLTYLVTGPISWEPYAEVRLLKDIRNDYWNNLADAGLGHRWRLLRPFSLQLLIGVHGGGYFGLEGDDPAPDDLSYGELRVQLGGYASF